MINSLFTTINTFRMQKGVPALKADALGNKDAELRASQFQQYMATHQPGSPGFNPHTGYDTTAASIGWNLISENLAFSTGDPNYIVYTVWQDSLHLAALLATDANAMGVSCVYSSSGIPYWTYEPGVSGAMPIITPTTTPALDSEEIAFLGLINNYRAQNGAGALQVSEALENSSLWMSNDMATKNYASHTDSLGRSAGTRIAAFNYPYFPWGENISGGYADAQSNFTGWVNACDPDSTGACTYAHRLNMLNASFKVIGIGRAYAANSNYQWYWVTDFGGVVDATIPINPPPVGTPAPTIGSFLATPSTVAAGQQATLSWSVSGAATVTIDNGVGDVSGVTSKSVSPSASTTYTLTATNGGGSSTAKVTVSVNTTTPDTQPPTTPTLTAAVAKTSNEVDLTWTASTDNVGVSGYQIQRNGLNVINVGANTLAFADTGVIASTAYAYTIHAYDAAGNYSNASNSIQVTTPGSTGGGGGAYTVKIAPSTVAPGGNMSVTFTAPAGHPAMDWLGLYPVGAPFYYLISVNYPGAASSGTISIPAPTQPGQYEIRFFNAGGFVSTATSNPVTVSTSVPATYTVSATPASVQAGANLTVTYTAPAGHSTLDWVGLYQAGAASGSYLSKTYLPAAASGSLTVTAPVQAGNYEIRLSTNDSFTVVATSLPVSVIAAPPAVTYTVSASPASLQTGGSLTVNYTAPAGHSTLDWAGLYPVGAASGAFLSKTYLAAATSGTLALPAPAQAGTFEIRLSTNDGFTVVATSTPITVTAPPVGGGTVYGVTVSPTTIAAGKGSITVSWTAPNGHSAQDWLGLYVVNENFTRYYTYNTTGAATSGSFTLAAPAQPGKYEIRLSTNGSFSVATTSSPITVTP